MKHITCDRKLTPEEAARYKAIREQVAGKFPHLISRHHAREALELARQKAAGCENWAEFWNYLFGIGGKLGELFPTQAEHVAFTKTDESKEIMRILEEPQGDDDDLPEKLAQARGEFILRVPKLLHAALMAEAQAEGVSLNQLCMAKLATQLRASLFLKS